MPLTYGGMAIKERGSGRDSASPLSPVTPEDGIEARQIKVMVEGVKEEALCLHAHFVSLAEWRQAGLGPTALARDGEFLVYYAPIRPMVGGLKRTNRGLHPTVKAD